VFPSYATPHVSAKPSRNQSPCNVRVLLNGAPVMSRTRSSMQKRLDNRQKSGRLFGVQPMSGIVDIRDFGIGKQTPNYRLMVGPQVIRSTTRDK
jgi:hypothetical protein